jgi:hypothetical protein
MGGFLCFMIQHHAKKQLLILLLFLCLS